MSDAYAKEHSESARADVIRAWSQRPGKTNEDGTPSYFTQQHSKQSCDVNEIIRHYTAGQLITHVSKFEARYGDGTAVEFKEALDLVNGALSDFQELPSKIRKRFKNSPMELLKFMEDPANRDEAIQLGLINKDWSVETDGLGEHVKENEHQVKPEIENPPDINPA